MLSPNPLHVRMLHHYSPLLGVSSEVWGPTGHCYLPFLQVFSNAVDFLKNFMDKVWPSLRNDTYQPYVYHTYAWLEVPSSLDLGHEYCFYQLFRHPVHLHVTSMSWDLDMVYRWRGLSTSSVGYDIIARRASFGWADQNLCCACTVVCAVVHSTV